MLERKKEDQKRLSFSFLSSFYRKENILNWHRGFEESYNTEWITGPSHPQVISPLTCMLGGYGKSTRNAEAALSGWQVTTEGSRPPAASLPLTWRSAATKTSSASRGDRYQVIQKPWAVTLHALQKDREQQNLFKTYFFTNYKIKRISQVKQSKRKQISEMFLVFYTAKVKQEDDKV